MTEIVDFLKKYTDGKQNTEKVEISVLQLNRVIKALDQEPVLDKDCEHCSKTYGTLGCCDTVSNEWVYSCKEGQREYLLNKIRAEIEALPKTYPFVNHFDMYVKVIDVTKIIDKYKEK